MNSLHDIPREITTPKINETWKRAIAAFQRVHNNRHPIHVEVSAGEVTRVLYRNGNFDESRPLQEFLPHEMENWVTGRYADWRSTDKIQWDLITVINV